MDRIMKWGGIFLISSALLLYLVAVALVIGSACVPDQ